MVPIEQLKRLSPKRRALLLLQERLRRSDRGEMGKLYKDDGVLRREFYPKHVAMFAAGAEHRQRVALGGNRVGKSYGIGGYETAVHATGLYPHWWVGARFDKPLLMWCAGTKTLKTRDVNQQMLVGRLSLRGATTISSGGLIPQRLIGKITRKSGVPDTADRVHIKHVSGHWNVLAFKSYEENRKAFEAEAVDWCWLDEEPPPEIFDECMMRVLTKSGHIMVTLTPVEGYSATVIRLLEGTELL